MILLAFRNLFQNKARLMVSAGGVALALMLILTLEAIMTGVERQITAYIDNSGADLFVSQKDVYNMHMASSSIPAGLAGQIRDMEGVGVVVPVLYLTNMVVTGKERNLAYILGVPEDASFGSAWQVSAGKKVPGAGEAVIDRAVAQASGISLEDQVEILGRPFTVVGLSEGTANLINSVAFISFVDFQKVRGSYDTASFLLVRAAPGVPVEELTRQIKSRLPEVTVQQQESFASEERRVVKDMSTDLISIMNTAGFLTGLAVMALTVYTAVFSKLKEFGVLKALGASRAYLYRVVVAQAFLCVGIGFSLGLAFTLAIKVLAPLVGPGLILEISLASIGKVGLVSLVIAGMAAVLPVSQVAGLDPALVFRGK